MMNWIQQTLDKQSQDPNIIWKTSYDHHPLFGVDADDYREIIKDFLPGIQAHNYDIFFNGHEHMMTLSTAPVNGMNKPKELSWW